MQLIWLVPVFPLVGFLALVLAKGLRDRAAGILGSAAAGLSAAAACAVAWLFVAEGSNAYVARSWTWLDLGSASPSIALSVDALSIVMILVVTIVGFLIHLFSIEHMAGEEGYRRFFAYMNLFIAFMLILVLADNFLLLYLGWEGVGLCSFLLIGFWHRDRANGAAARKAFIVTRVGDVALLLGILLVAASLGSLDIGEASRRAGEAWLPGSGIALLAAALILGGALGKSAQLPLHTWLPDAMAGPSPVSALIHAATMVTAGVYLVARANVFFVLAPQVMTAVAVVGAATLLVAGASALAQRDLKRILAYSTMSQIGYMFLALGVASWTGAVFHLATHALFKSLLFLAAGAVINALGHERDVFAMGGVAKKMPLLFWVFLAGAFGLTALPPVTSGLASKDAIIAGLWHIGGEARLLWWAAMAGVFLTSLYTFRMLFLVFAGKSRAREPGQGHGQASSGPRGAATLLPLLLLAAACLAAGLLDFPHLLGGVPFFGDLLGGALPAGPAALETVATEFFLLLAPLCLSLLGIPVAWVLARRGISREGAARAAAPAAFGAAQPKGLAAFVRGGFGFDRLYAFLFVKPLSRLAGAGVDPVNLASEGLKTFTMRVSSLLRSSQDGRPRRYLAVLAFGAAILLAAVLLILLLFLAIPLFCGIAGLAFGGRPGAASRAAPRVATLVGSLACLALAVWAWIVGALPQKLDLPWIPAIGAGFSLSLDGLSLPFLALSGLLGAAAVIASWKGIEEKVPVFHLCLSLSLAGIHGVFLASDLLLFAFFWELMLVPMFFVIDIWGHEGRHRAAVKFFIFTQAGGLLMIAAIAGLYAAHAAATGEPSFAYDRLLGTVLPPSLQLLLMLGFFAAFAVKLPAFGLHAWLPDAHTEAPTAGSILLAGLLLKTGGYGMLRFAIPLFPEASRAFGPYAMWIGAAGIVWGGLMALGQRDMKRLVAYSSVSHLGFVLVGIYSFDTTGRNGAVIQMLAHGLSTGALFMLAGGLQDRIGTRDLSLMGGLSRAAPRMGAFGLILSLALLGLPGMGNFVGELYVLFGAFRSSPAVAVVAALGLILAMVYALRLFQLAFHGEARVERKLADLSGIEALTLGLLVAILLWVGLYPKGVLSLVALVLPGMTGGIAP